MYGFILTVKSKEAIIGMSVYMGVNERRLSFSTLQGWICKINISFKDWIIVGPQHDIWAGQWKWFKFTLEYIKKKSQKALFFTFICNHTHVIFNQWTLGWRRPLKLCVTLLGWNDLYREMRFLAQGNDVVHEHVVLQRTLQFE